jgi:phosphinothricin acetyltransferase
MWVDQAIFTSLNRSGMSGYHVVARSVGVTEAEANALATWSPSLDALIVDAEAAGIWTIQTGIFPENSASLGLHERCGFRIVGRRERIGRLNGVWRDTLFLERRSPIAGG